MYQAGQRFTAGSTTSPGTCTSCPAGQFQTATSHQVTSCQACTSDGEGRSAFYAIYIPRCNYPSSCSLWSRAVPVRLWWSIRWRVRELSLGPVPRRTFTPIDLVQDLPILRRTMPQVLQQTGNCSHCVLFVGWLQASRVRHQLGRQLCPVPSWNLPSCYRLSSGDHMPNVPIVCCRDFHP